MFQICGEEAVTVAVVGNDAMMVCEQCKEEVVSIHAALSHEVKFEDLPSDLKPEEKVCAREAGYVRSTEE